MKIYTDGSCYVSNKKGTWAFIAILDEHTELHSSGFSNDTTNNIMEVSAILNALKTFPARNDIEIYSDSMYAINCAQKIWQRKKNVELWEEYDRIVNKRRVIFHWVRGHNGNKYNEMVDKLTKEAYL